MEKKGATLSVVPGGRKKGTSEEKKVGDSLGKAGERGKKGETLSVVGSERKRRASEEKKGGLSR